MDNDEFDIHVEISSQIDRRLDLDKLKSLSESVCRRFTSAETFVSIAVIDDASIADINKQFLGHTGPTDVISFDLSDENDGGSRNFEIVINYDQAARQSAERSHDTASELALYITHGLLHNFGYDDRNEQDAKKMHELEDELLQEEGFGAVYGK